jgi:energy-converting hydrogenase Eha subunit H
MTLRRRFVFSNLNIYIFFVTVLRDEILILNNNKKKVEQLGRFTVENRVAEVENREARPRVQKLHFGLHSSNAKYKIRQKKAVVMNLAVV